MESILNSVKKQLGLPEDYSPFDPDIIMAINTTFVIINQLGVGPDTFFSISDKTTTWSDFWGDKEPIEMVKTYMFMKVKMIFDPPAGAAKESYDNLLAEMEFRMNIHVDPGKED